jgi:hypothetical protein
MEFQKTILVTKKSVGYAVKGAIKLTTEHSIMVQFSLDQVTIGWTHYCNGMVQTLAIHLDEY